MVDDPSKTSVEDEAFELDLDADTSLEEALQDAVASVAPANRPKPGDESTSDGQVAQLETDLAEARDRLARTLADFDNFRKRVDREKSELRRYAVAEPLAAFLDVSDNIQRAMEAPGGVDDLKKGLEMTVRSLDTMLRRFGVEAIEAEGVPFDPNLHEAVARQEGDVTEPTVVAEYQRGYRLHERLLRPSRVVVAVPAASETSREDRGD